MSDLMKPLTFAELMRHILMEYKLRQTIFNVKKIYRASERCLSIFGGHLDNPLGPAAGPHTQLAQNIVAAYAAGGRFIELKTVQKLEGPELHISKPCISSHDECYNVEWSTELTLSDAFEEYVKAWYALKLISREFELGAADGFIFNMSVGYDLEGISSPSVDAFIEGLKDAARSEVWNECEEWATRHASDFANIDEDYIRSISPKISTSITLSTMHGCPAEDIEKIAAYLMTVKQLHTYIKCNPTLLGYEFTRKTLDEMGYDYLVFDEQHFQDDLHADEAVPMLRRLLNLAAAEKRTLGIKLSNTFPVKIRKGELPGEEMYMSGKSLYPLTIALSAMLSASFEGKLPISYSGGADKNNIEAIFAAGIWPVTLCSVLLKPIGVEVMKSLADKVTAMPYPERQEPDESKLIILAEQARSDNNYRKSEITRQKMEEDAKKGIIHDSGFVCRVLCGNCVAVCPNRSNEIILTDNGKRIVHIDRSCNECGNCGIHCVQPCLPYKDRITLFANSDDMNDSENNGFAQVGEQYVIRWEGRTSEVSEADLPKELKGVVDAMKKQHPYYFI